MEDWTEDVVWDWTGDGGLDGAAMEDRPSGGVARRAFTRSPAGAAVVIDIRR